ncbi:MAG: hypothetical protein ACJ75S_08645 [Solirubrobacterales bacterium]
MATVSGNSGIIVLGKWLESKYPVTFSENPAFGGVSCVHTGQCKRYWTNEERAANGASRHYAAAAIDGNADGADESKVLNEIYDLLAPDHAALGIKEMFFENRGIPTPVPDHYNHIHIGIDGPPTPALIKLVTGIGDKPLSFIPDALGSAAGSAADFAGEQASNLAKGIVSAMLDALGADGARILLYIVLVGGGAILIYYGLARAAGVQKPIGTAATLAVAAPK